MCVAACLLKDNLIKTMKKNKSYQTCGKKQHIKESLILQDYRENFESYKIDNKTALNFLANFLFIKFQKKN